MAEQPQPDAPDANATIVTVDGNRLETLETGKGRLAAILDLIDKAKDSLRVIFYIFASDEAGTQVRDALVRAARRGVVVRLLLDGYGSSDTDAKFFQPIADAGGAFCMFLPRYGRRYLIRNHQKLVIADERRAIIGGANVETVYLTDEGDKYWRDLWVLIEGSACFPASRYFDSLFLWTQTKGAKLMTLRRIVMRYSQSEGPLQWKFSGPLSMRNSWWRSIGRDMRRAKQLDMIFAYFAPPGAMLRRIGGVGRRGRARIINAARSDNNATIGAARHCYSRLLRRHVEIYEYQPAKLHTKLVIVDDVVHIGSSNFDYRSFYLNMEVMLRIHDKGFAQAMRGYFERELKDCKWITHDVHDRRSTLWRRVRWGFAHFLVNVIDYSVTRRLNFGADR